MILETTAGRRPPLQIGVVSPVVVELRPAANEPQVRHIVRVIPGAVCCQFPSQATEDRALPPKGLYALSPEFYAAAGRVGTASHPH